MLRDELAEVFLQEVFFPLAREESFSRLLSLAEVCRQWKLLIYRVTHLNLWLPLLNEERLEKILKDFPLVESLDTDADILFFPCQGVNRIKSLAISSPGCVESVQQVSIARWTRLQTLIYTDFGYAATHHRISDLHLLSNSLTTLHIHSSALEDHTKLRLLSGLETLHLSQFLDNSLVVADTLQELTNLKFFSSDRLAHFAQYTGAGKLNTFVSGDRELRPFLSVCGQIKLAGQWLRGAFTGQAWMYSFGHNGSGMEYNGTIVSSVREGPGVEIEYGCYDEGLHVYRGNWSCGQRHGSFSIQCFAKNGDTEPVDVFTGHWNNGRRIE
jgi:hypothetical protein